jgi:hypothetical protein
MIESDGDLDLCGSFLSVFVGKKTEKTTQSDFFKVEEEERPRIQVTEHQILMPESRPTSFYIGSTCIV